MASPNLASILSYLCFLMRFGSFFVQTHDGFCRFLQHVKFQVDTGQSDFPEKIAPGNGLMRSVIIWSQYSPASLHEH